jgi:tRNA(adenine34) deaminase
MPGRGHPQKGHYGRAFFSLRNPHTVTRATLPPHSPSSLRAQARIDETWMGLCLVWARRAAERGEVPVGAIVVCEGRVVGRGFNLRERHADPTAHAEVLALREAGARMGHWRLQTATLYVTLEPCPMCAGALVNARVGRLVYGCTDPKAGAVESLFGITTDSRLNHRLKVSSGIRSDECAQILRHFFSQRRSRRAEIEK